MNIDTRNLSILQFDPLNPRLPTTVKGDDEAAVIEWMLEDATIIELMLSIGQNGYFEGEPLLVTEDRSSGALVVVEGNRRLCALKLLANPNLAKYKRNAVRAAAEQAEHHPDLIPVAIFPRREEILNYLGYRHITGVKPWGPLAKSRYLKQLADRYRQDLGLDGPELDKALAKSIGSNRNHVRKLLIGLEVYNTIEARDFYDIKGLTEESLDFSLLTTALSYANIAAFVGLKDPESDDSSHDFDVDESNLGELVHWIYKKDPQTRKSTVGESRNLKTLNHVVGSEKALSALRVDGNLESARRFTVEPAVVFSGLLARARDSLLSAQTQQHGIDVTKEHERILIEVQKIANNMLLAASARA